MSSLRRLARSARVLVAMLVVLAPLGLGPATGAIARVLGSVDHTCTCASGGTHASCPVCNPSLRGEGRSRVPALQGTPCGEGRLAVPTTPLPPGVLPGELALEAPALEESLPSPPIARLRPADRDGPPTPPPRV